MAGTKVKRTRNGYWFLHRGESIIASTGLALAAILLSAMAGAAWWTLNTQRESMIDARTAEIDAVGEVLAKTLETMLAVNELSAVRRTVVEAAHEHNLSICRIVIGEGLIVADNEPRSITAHQMPTKWAFEPAPDFDHVSDSDIVRTYMLMIPNRGLAQLKVTGSAEFGPWVYWEAQTGVAAFGAVGLALILLVYRRMRRRLRALGAIRESLLAAASGEKSLDALSLNHDLGEVAAAWNRFLEEKDQQQKELFSSRVHEPAGLRRDCLSDLERACDVFWQGLIIVDEEGVVKYANGAAAVLLKTKRDDMIGQTIDSFIKEPRVTDSIRDVVGGDMKRRSTVEVQNTGDDGHGVLRFNVRPVRRGDSASAMVLVEDITQLRLAEEARNSFVAHATHELRTPLTNIRLYVESAIEDGEQDPTILAKSLNVINQESRRLERIVGDMLSVAEIDAGTLKLREGDVRLETLFTELDNDFQAQAKDKNITLTFNLPPKFPVIHGDRDKIVLAMHNLIGNALKYTPEGGQVTVAVEVDNNSLTVQVVDTGIGIDEKEVDRVFEKFYRAKDRRVGTITGSGLGLTLAREVIRLHGGDITVQSQVDHGSTFTMTLPALARAA